MRREREKMRQVMRVYEEREREEDACGGQGRPEAITPAARVVQSSSRCHAILSSSFTCSSSLPARDVFTPPSEKLVSRGIWREKGKISGLRVRETGGTGE